MNKGNIVAKGLAEKIKWLRENTVSYGEAKEIELDNCDPENKRDLIKVFQLMEKDKTWELAVKMPSGQYMYYSAEYLSINTLLELIEKLERILGHEL